ncbi:MAG: M67 family metallopeptidase [Actinobacteria bacterium]|nr:M67 family metallopeptidase [Actinomycetota bacterium]MBV9665573.1 M67 family metallopeptidase [Actinomycetota bacterium]MBV9935205.1 M67 family metallopeptidase [Actinomycetota bacterium]
MLRLGADVYLRMVGHCFDGLPLEACGLLGGNPVSGLASVCYPAKNVAESSKLYTVDPLDHLKADRDAEGRGLEIIGVFHSHTHTDAYPSPTDVAQAPDPTWHYVLVSLRDEAPVVRSYRIVDGNIAEEPVVLEAR